DAETEAGAVCDAGGNGQTDGVANERIAGPAAVRARFGPALAAAAARRARAAHRNLERKLDAAAGVAPRQRDFRRQRLHLAAFTEKRLTHPLQQPVRRREVDRDLVGKAVVRRSGLAAPAPDGRRRGTAEPLAMHSDLTLGG